jgi:hypothetical protein
MVVPQTSLTCRHPEFSPPFSPVRPKPEIIRCIGFRTGPFIMHQIVAVAVDSSRRWWVLAIAVAALFMFGVDACIVNVAIPTVAVDLHANWTGANRTRIDPRAAGAVRRIGAVGAVDCDQCRISVMDAPRELIPCKIPANDSTRPFYFAVQQLSGLG